MGQDPLVVEGHQDCFHVAMPEEAHHDEWDKISVFVLGFAIPGAFQVCER